MGLALGFRSLRRCTIVEVCTCGCPAKKYHAGNEADKEGRTVLQGSMLTKGSVSTKVLCVHVLCPMRLPNASLVELGTWRERRVDGAVTPSAYRTRQCRDGLPKLSGGVDVFALDIIDYHW